MLGALGLSDTDERVYRCMLDQPGLGVAEIAQRLSIEADVVRAALTTLADLALLRVTGEALRPVRPQAGLLALLAKAEADVVARQREIEATRAAINSIAAVHAEAERQDEGRRLEGIEAVRERLVELQELTRFECLSFSTGGAQRPDDIDAEKPLNQIALERGVRIRNLYLDSVRNDPGTLAHARWMMSMGSQSRTVPTLPMRLVIIDREVALVPIDPHRTRAGALELRQPGVVAGLVALFEHLWTTGTPFGQAMPRDEHDLSPNELALIRLLADGHTDESAARKLAVSVRSVQRMMTGLTERLGAASRFQAGVESARRGWLDQQPPQE
ncbi:transcriptional regulator [Catellatospora sp. TT07R-123]|uniref:LuxR family transcriptional regulator n=1 Tax=Catellatospora sp. TT07R-123 TaxID=2733863 RepID=UPI001B2D0811|nr:LuxR family transcriptional regulator [Catellatospora sp. TT07R-123]GHJ50158.1 transcriptional regulator [Catellatospora sp. TT07R-123]